MSSQSFAGPKSYQVFFFALPSTVDSDKSITLLATLIQRWEYVRADIMEEWKKKSQWNGMHQQKKQEEQRTQCGKRCWIWNHARQKRVQRIQEQSHCQLIGKKAFQTITVDCSMELGSVLQVPSIAATYALGVLCASKKSLFLKSSAAAPVLFLFSCVKRRRHRGSVSKKDTSQVLVRL